MTNETSGPDRTKLGVQARQSRAFAGFLILLGACIAASGIWVLWLIEVNQVGKFGQKGLHARNALILGLFLGALVSGCGILLRRLPHRRIETLALLASPLLVLAQINQVLLAYHGYLVAKPDSKLGYRLWPNTVYHWWSDPTKLMRINSEGLNSDEVPAEKSPAETRVLVIGDSVTMGFEVNREETYPARLEELPLRDAKADRRDFHVINAGILGYGVDQERKLLEEKLKLKPDIVVHQLCMNDPMDYVQSGTELKGAWENRLGFLGYNGGFMPWLTNGTGIGIHFAIKLEPYLRKERDRRWLKYLFIAHHDTSSAEKAELVERGWQGVEKEILISRELARRTGARYLLLVAPLGEQVMDVGMNASQERMIQFARKNRIEILDLGSILRTIVHRKVPGETPGQILARYYMWDKIHFTPAGHQLVAEAIYARLLESGWIPGSKQGVDEGRKNRALTKNQQGSEQHQYQ